MPRTSNAPVRATAVHPSISSTPLAASASDLATVCVLCSHNCGVRVDVEDNRIVAVRPDKTNPITAGYICNKAVTIVNYVEHDQRVEHPLRRRADGSFERIDWHTAITEIAARLSAIHKTYGPRSIGLVGVGGQANHLDGPWALGLLKALGSRRWFNAYGQEKTQHNLVDYWMMDAPPAAFFHADQARSKYTLVLGTNPKISNRGHNATDTFKKLSGDPSRTVVVLDPRVTETTKGADRHLRVRPGGDVFFLIAMAASIVQHELYDSAFVEQSTSGFGELRDVLTRVDIGEMAARAGLEAADIETVAEEFARAESASMLFDLGVELTPFSTLNSWLIRVNLALTGNLGREGGNVFFGAFTPSDWSRNRHEEPERALASGIGAIRALGNAAMFSPTLVPEEILIDHPERLRAVFIESSNPWLSYSDTGAWHRARPRLDLLVVIDPAFTESAREADYVLPATCGYEKWEMALFPKGYPEIHVQVRPPVVAGPADALPEPEIYVRLLEAMGLVAPLPEELASLASVASMPEGRGFFLGTAMAMAPDLTRRGIDVETQILVWAYRVLGPALPSPTLVSVYLLAQRNAMTRRDAVLRVLGPEWQDKTAFELGEEIFARILAHPEGVEVARLELGRNLHDHIGYEDKRIRLAVAPMMSELERALAASAETAAEYPFVLANGLRTRWTANTIQRDPAWRKGAGPHCTLSVHPGDAARLGLGSGDLAVVATAVSSITLPVQLDERLMAGHASMPNGFGTVVDKIGGGDGSLDVSGDSGAPPRLDGANGNEITDTADRDPFTGIPHHRYVRCRISKAQAPATA